MIYIGLDVHTKQSYFCVMDKMGQCLEHKSMVTTEEGFRDLVRRYKVGE